MLKDGSLVEAKSPKPEERYGDQLFRFSPREVLLAPQVEQIVRIMAIPGEDASEGDYRAHFRFEEVGDSGLAERASATPGQPNMVLQARVAIAVPVVYRNGGSGPEVELRNLEVKARPSGDVFYSVEIDRMGEAYPYGTLRATLIDTDGSARQVGLVKGISSYLDHRTAGYPLDISDLSGSRGSTLRLEYLRPEDEGGKPMSVAETKLR